MSIKTICAWCGKLIKDGPTDKDGKVSHGICPECAEKVTKNLPKEKKKR